MSDTSADTALPIFLDYQATTPTDPRVVEAMQPYFNEHFGNQHSVHHLYGRDASDAVERARKTDANDRLYQLEASMDYDPTDGLSAIKAKVITLSFADDQLNPIELGVVERALEQIQDAQHVIVPAGPETLGHFSARYAKHWAEYAGVLLS